VKTFGASAPLKELQKQLGSEPDQVVRAAFIAIDFFDDRTLKEGIGLAGDSFAPFFTFGDAQFVATRFPEQQS
jgi:hypothetical protein